MKKQSFKPSVILLIFYSILVLFNTNIYAQNKLDNVLQQEYSYESVSGINLDINLTDFLNLNKDGSFQYQVDYIYANGNWELLNDVLVFKYINPVDTIRYFSILEANKKLLVLVEGDKKFVLKHSFPNKINIFSKNINNFFSPIVDKIGSVIFYDITKPFGQDKNIPFIVIWLIFGAVFFTIKMSFINFRGFRHALSLVKGDYHNPNNIGEVSHFQALTTALSGTVGLGNIAGVAIAISLGGPGATFWMIIAGLLGMSSKFVECTLGVKYRQINSEGVVYGGPMYYLRDGLAKRNLKNLGKFLAVLFAVLCVGGSIGGGNMFQANQAFSAIKGIFPSLSNLGPVFGLVFAFLVGFVIIGGIKSIAKVTEKIVPFMAAMYVGASLIIILMHFSDIGFVISEIINGAFTPEAGLGGVIGVLITGQWRQTDKCQLLHQNSV